MEILARRFGKKIKLPPTVQIKREILLSWLADQTEIEAAEARKGYVEKQPAVGMPKVAQSQTDNSGSELHPIGVGETAARRGHHRSRAAAR
jgi:hypothetical protein